MKKVGWMIYSFFVFVPFGLLVVHSFGGSWAYPALQPSHWRVEAWLALVRNPSLLAGVVWSLAIASSGAVVGTCIALLTGRRIARSRRRRLLIGLAYVPYLLSPVILAAVWLYFFNVAELTGRWLGVWVGQLLVLYPFGVLLLDGFWNSTVLQLESVALNLGVSPPRTFGVVILPVLAPAIRMCFVQLFLVSWYEYGLTSLLGIGKVQTLPVLVFQYLQEANVALAAVAGLAMVLPPLALLEWAKRGQLI